jgi:hypothetical protein
MEIHPPQHGIQSWREFLLHMTTIVLGILIAIGLEQTVEWVHHRQERSQLQSELREEAEKNRAIITEDLRLVSTETWTTEAMKTVAASRAGTDGRIRLELGRVPCTGGSLNTPGVRYFAPSEAVWTAASESGLTAVIPAPEARVYARLQHNLALLTALRDRVAMTCDEVVSLQRRLAVPRGEMREWTLTVEQAEKLGDAAGALDTAMRAIVYRLKAVLVCEDAIVKGELDANKIIAGISAVYQPTDAEDDLVTPANGSD